MSETPRKRAKMSSIKECRACLTDIHDDSCCVDIFRSWETSLSGMGVSIAQDLAKLASIQITVTDPYSKSICKKCCNRLKDAINFAWGVQNSDLALRKRHIDFTEENSLWPKPIQVDKSTSNALNEMTVEVKQEELTDDEYDMNENCSEQSDPNLDIKIEPEEMTPATHPIIEDKDLLPLSQPTKPFEANGATEYFEESLLGDVKEEPMSEDETEPITDMPKDCMLCLKTFNTVRGLKAHVIAVHSYETVTSPRVDRANVCATCNRGFATRTDLFVHETCHSKFACYVCDKKFETFLLLTKHRSKQCTKTSVLPRLKTLEDVRRIARCRGTETLKLFDIHIPIARIKEMKINEEECRSIMMTKEKRVSRKDNRRKPKEEPKGKGENKNGARPGDPLLNILNDNVMSVVVNVRLPEDLKPKIENKESLPSDNFIKTEQHYDIKVEPKSEPECNEDFDTGTFEQKLHKQNLDRPTFEPQNVTSRGIPITRAKVLSESSRLDLDKDEVKAEATIGDDNKKQYDSNKAESTQKRKKAKKNKGKNYKPLRCTRNCQEIIPEEFRQHVFDYYRSLTSLKERRSFLSTLVDRVEEPNDGSNENSSKIKYRSFLKLGDQCYDICKLCLSETLGAKYDVLHNSQRLLMYKTHVQRKRKRKRKRSISLIAAKKKASI